VSRAYTVRPTGVRRLDAEASDGFFNGYSEFSTYFEPPSIVRTADGSYVRIGGAAPDPPGRTVAVSWEVDYQGPDEYEFTGGGVLIKYRGDRDPALVPSSPPMKVRFLVNEVPLPAVEVPSVAPSTFVTAIVPCSSDSLPTRAQLDAGIVRLQLVADALSAWDPNTLAEFDIDQVSVAVPAASPLRNAQRDDARGNQRTSWQLSTRNNAYL
jgi:hypothetical protein